MPETLIDAQRRAQAEQRRATILPLLVLLVLAGVGVWQIASFLSAVRRADETDQEIARINDIYRRVVDMETGVRGYLATGDRAFLDPYTAAFASLLPDLESGSPQDSHSRELLSAIEGEAKAWNTEHALPAIAHRAAPGGVVPLALSLEGKARMDGIRRRFDELLHRQEQLRLARSERAERAGELVLWIIGGLLTVGLASIGATTKRGLTAVARAYEVAHSAIVESREQSAQASLYRVELERVRLEREYNTFFDIGLDLYCIADREGRFLKVNPAFQRVLGHSAEELLSTSYLGLVHSDDVPSTEAMAAKVTGGAPATAFENRCRCKDGSYRWLSWTAVSQDGRVYAVARDVTEVKATEASLRRSEEKLREARKMEAYGQLAGGVAHEFNNILTVIRGSAELVLNSLRQDQVGERKLLEDVERASARGASLTQQLLAFTGKQVQRPRQVDLRHLVTAHEPALREAVGTGMSLRVLYPEAPLGVRVDELQIQQVLLQLATNARDAMAGAGQVTLELGRESVQETRSGALSVPPGDYVALSVIDTGTGIDQASQQHLFEPFFTTKELGKGTGLGLATVLGILRQSGAGLSIETAEGRGTTIRILIPLVEPGVLGPTTRTVPRPLAQSPRKTILVAEDDEAVREFIVTVLGTAAAIDCEIVVARDGEEALQLFESHAGPIDVLVTDVRMPRLDGVELVAAIGAKSARTKVLYISGHSDRQLIAGELSEGEVGFLSKPFKVAELVRGVKALLDTVTRRSS